MRSIPIKRQNGTRKKRNNELLKLNPTERLVRKSDEKRDMMMNM